MNKIQRVYLRTTPIIPLAYDDSLSYLEVLQKLERKTDECIETINNIIDVTQNHELRITAVETDMVNLRNEFVEFKAEINTQFDELEEALTARVDHVCLNGCILL